MDILHRDIVKRFDSWMERDEIIIIFGTRQVGKTSLLRYMQAKLDSEGKKTYFIDLEDIELRNAISSARELTAFLEALGWEKGVRAYIFLDEIHYMENAPSILKYLHDHFPELKFIVTGSSSLKLKFKMAEPLTGRKVVFILYPLSFVEFLDFTRRKELKRILVNSGVKPIPDPFLSQIATVYEEYVIYGGYPKVALTQSYEMKIQVLKEIQTTYVEKEIRSLVAEENFGKFSSFIGFIAAQNGGLVNVTEISKEVGIARDTVVRYLSILEETFVIGMLKPWARSRQKELTKMPKLYFLDTGFLNYTLKNFQNLLLHPGTGALIESVVFTIFQRKCKGTEEIRYWRTKSKAEVDFVLKRNNKIIPIEIKWSERIKIPNGLRIFLKTGVSNNAYVILKNIYDEKNINDNTITFLPPWVIEPTLWEFD